MFRNLSTLALGITGRQSELIELALTYGYRGVDVDMGEFSKRVDNTSVDHAARFLESAGLKVGSFDLPIDWSGDDASYTAEFERLKHVCEIASTIKAKRCVALIPPASDEIPYHENFERQRKRFHEIADVLGGHSISLAIGLQAATELRKGREYQFIYQVDDLLTLIKSISAKNVGLALDTWNWRVGGGSLEQLRDFGSERILVARLADAPEDVDMSALSATQRLVPGQGGLVDNEAMVKVLVEGGYSGPLTVFPHPSCFVGMTRDAIVQQATEALEEIYQQVEASSGEPATASEG